MLLGKSTFFSEKEKVYFSSRTYEGKMNGSLTKTQQLDEISLLVQKAKTFSVDVDHDLCRYCLSVVARCLLAGAQELEWAMPLVCPRIVSGFILLIENV